MFIKREFALQKAPLLAITSLIIGGCTVNHGYHRGDSAPNVHVNVENIPNAVPRAEPQSKYGNPESYEVLGKTYHTLNSAKGFVQQGIASWYGTKFHGRRTSSGEPYNIYAMTAAHKTLPLPTYVEVKNLDNGRSVVVKVNDRGPFHEGRIIDLSYVAAMKLGIAENGTGHVEIRAIDPTAPLAHKERPEPIQPPKAQNKSAIQTASTAENKKTTPPPPQNIYLQVGAFNSFLNADSLKNRLNQISNSPVVISKAVDTTTPVYRVRIGPLDSDLAAQQLVSRLIDLGITQPRVIID